MRGASITVGAGGPSVLKYGPSRGAERAGPVAAGAVRSDGGRAGLRPALRYAVLELGEGGEWRVYRSSGGRWRSLGTRTTMRGTSRLIERDKRAFGVSEAPVTLGWLW